MTNQLETARLILRLPRREDIDVFAALWADPETLKDLPNEPLTRVECWPRLLRIAGSWALLGYGNWLVFEKSGDFVGVIGFFDLCALPLQVIFVLDFDLYGVLALELSAENSF